MQASKHSLTLPDPTVPLQTRELSYLQWGDESNPKVVVCVHGLSRNARDFAALATALADHYRVIAIDMPGRGSSGRLGNVQDYNYLTYMKDALFVLDTLGIPNVDWVGTSMGGIIGMMIAAHHPLRIKRLVLNDIGAVMSAAGLKRILSYVGARSVFPSREEAMSYLKDVLTPFGLQGEDQWNYMFDATFDAQPNGFTLAYDPAIITALKAGLLAAGEIADVDLSAMWEIISCQVLILRGTESDILSSAAAQKMLTRSAPTELVEFAGVGHAPALIDAAQIGVITAWLDKPSSGSDGLLGDML